MFGISSFFGRSTKGNLAANARYLPVDRQVTLKELEHMAIRKFFVESGIPLDLFAVTVKHYKQQNNVLRTDIKILVVKWHEGLGKFVYPIQSRLAQVLADVAMPNQKSQDVSISWVFHSRCSNAPSNMPRKEYWHAPKLKFDLPKADRDIAVARRDAHQLFQPTLFACFAPTVPASIH